MEKYIGLLRKYKDVLQTLHWNTGKDYAKHLLFERLEGEIPAILDRLVEVYLGNNDVAINEDEIKCEVPFDGDLIAFIKQIRTKFNILLISSGESLQNVIVDIIEMLDRHLYLL